MSRYGTLTPTIPMCTIGTSTERSQRAVEFLSVYRALHRLREIDRLAFAPVVQEEVARRLLRHVLVDGDDVDAVGAHRLENCLQLALEHGEVAIDDCLLIAARERGPGVDAHLVADLDAVHRRLATDNDLDHAVAGLRFRPEHLLDRCRRDAAGRRNVARKGGRQRGLGGAHLGNPVVDRLDSGGQAGRFSHAADMHEVDLRLVEEEVVVQRGHLQAGIERRAHRRVDLVFQEDGIAHDHRAAGHRHERGIGRDAHERRQGPAVDGGLDVGARLADLEDVLGLVVGTGQAGDRFDAHGVGGGVSGLRG